MRRPTRQRSSSLALACVALALPCTAAAQAYQCRVPASVPQPRAESGKAVRAPIDGYTLAISWSPEYCRGKERNPADHLQCAGSMGQFGFVVHGLWPEGSRGAPQYCAPVAAPPASVIRRQLCRTPTVALIAHEWTKHGSCIARRPETYFKIANIISDSLRYPAMERLAREGQRAPDTLTAGSLRKALATANPGRPAASFGLLLSRSGWLKEVKVCLDRRFRPRRCPARQYGPSDSAPLKIWRGL